MTHISNRCLIFCLLIIVVVFVSFGCQPKPMRSSVSQQIEKQTGKKLRTTPTELRLKVHHAAIPLSGIIEGYADQIINDTPDPAIRANALLWKINGIPAVHRAAFQPDPFLSLIDLWVFSIQMRLFFEEGAGKTALGPWHTTAYDGSRRIESIVTTLAREASADGDISKGQALVADWCREHPIESLLFIRKSVTVVLASVVGRESLGTLEVVGELAVGMADLSVQMTAYAEYLPKQARWQTELLLENLAASDKAEKALSEFTRLSRDVDRLTTLAEKLPDTVTAERKAILRALAQDLDNHQRPANRAGGDVCGHHGRAHRHAQGDRTAAAGNSGKDRSHRQTASRQRLSGKPAENRPFLLPDPAGGRAARGRSADFLGWRYFLRP